MLDETTLAKLIDRAPLAVIVIGVLVFIIGAAGGLPIGNPPLQVTDFAWRVGLGIMGLILVAAGLLLLSREDGLLISRSHKTTASKYGIRIESPREGAQVNEFVDIAGSYTVKPPDNALRLFTVVPDGGSFQPQAIVQFDAGKKWHGKVRLERCAPLCDVDRRGDCRCAGSSAMGLLLQGRRKDELEPDRRPLFSLRFRVRQSMG